MATRILLLTQWFDPEPTFKGIVFAKELLSQGFDVEVITGFPNYPGGKLYPGYRIKLFQKELVDGVKVIRVPLYPSHGQSGAGRVLNYVSFAAAASIYGVFLGRKPDVIYAYHPPLTVGLAAILIKFFRRAPVVYDIQDMWPDTLRATGMFSNERALGIVGKICDWVYRAVDHLVVLSPGFKKILIDRGVPPSKIDVIYNWCSEYALVTPTVEVSSAFPGKDKFRVLFAGNMGKAQALDAVIAAAELLALRAPDVLFIFMGGGVEVNRLQKLVKQRGLDNIEFLPAVPMKAVGAYLNAADVLLVHLKKDPLFSVTIPSKTQAYMAVGKPILMAVDGDAARLVLESGAGCVAVSEDAQSIAQAVLSLIDEGAEGRRRMSEKARDFYLEHLALSVGVSKFTKIFQALARR